MKRKILALFLTLSLLLCGCGSESRPADWQDDWTVIAPFLAAEPMESFSFGESSDMMGLSGVYYAAWTNGDAQAFTNAAGEETTIFNSQIYVVAQECATEAEARENLTAWMTREKQNYETGPETTVTLNGVAYTLLPLLSGSETNPYSFGCAAFGLSGSNAICVELVCSDTFTAEPHSVLEEFLQGLHYSE